MKRTIGYLVCLLIINSCYSIEKDAKVFNVDKQLRFCESQVKRSLKDIHKDSLFMPRSIDKNQTKWRMVDVFDWTSGFWPGILWYDFENTKNKDIKQEAIKYTEALQKLVTPEHTGDHDIGFQIFCSFGNAYRLTKNNTYKQIILAGADKLSKLYNPKVGTILSWPDMAKKMNWPHLTIMDNMMNLEILFWAAKNGGDKSFYDMAVRHATVTKENQFRADGSNMHVAIYDTISGKFIKGVTNQGYNDNSMWARGQSWAIYGYTMVYRETKDLKFLRFAEKVADIYLKRLPSDYVPFWDFDDPKIPNAPKDASAAAIVASALLELSQLEDDRVKANKYKTAAVAMLKCLSTAKYQSRNLKSSFLLYSTGNYPSGYEIDSSINYADYYYIEALLRYKKIQSEPAYRN